MNQILTQIKRLLAIIVFLASIQHTTANNLNISGSIVSGSNITFNISWENSWNVNTAPNNRDAVWVIVKYQDCATREWAHANLSTLSTDHTAGSPLQVDAMSDGKGVFIRRAAIGAGNISNTSVTLKMNITPGTYNYKVLGIEMVNVPSGDFYIGDGYNYDYTFIQRQITATNQSSGTSVYYWYSGNSTSYQYTLPSSYPMGTNSFYCMKYELSQQQYVDFLNSLTLSQQVNRTTNAPTSAAGTYALVNSGTDRNGIATMTSSNGADPAVYGCNLNSGNAFNSSDDGQNIACNYLSLADVTAYLDWAGLRPMTDIEFEKICRGPLTPLPGEYPWGNTTITAVNSANLINAGTASEGFSNTATGLCNYNNAMTGPVRVGYAATGSSGRSSSGAAYYGALDLGGNVLEFSVSISLTTFNGILGDGTINASGFGDATNWPSSVNVTARAGSFSTTSNIAMTVSNRQVTYSTSRNKNQGGRGVR